MDVQFIEYMIAAKENGFSFTEWPLVDAYVTRMINLPQLAAYLASDRRYPFPGMLLTFPIIFVSHIQPIFYVYRP